MKKKLLEKTDGKTDKISVTIFLLTFLVFYRYFVFKKNGKYRF